MQHGIVEKAGAWYAYRGERLGQGKDNVRQHLKAHPELAREIEARIRAKVLGVPAEQPAEAEAAELS